MTSNVRLGDGIDGLLSLTPGSSSLVLSDLPSGATRAAFDVPADLPRLWPAIWQALKPSGTAVLMASSLRFAAIVQGSAQSFFRHDIIWRKSIATGFLNAKRAPLRAHEFVLVFSRKLGTYNPQMLRGATPIHACRRLKHSENYGARTSVTSSRAGATDRYPVSVLDFASVGTSSKTRVHPQQKPVDLLRWLVRTYSNPGDLVVDPYAGSGSTGEAARMEERSFLGFDTSPRFARGASQIGMDS
jgi:site-specific DNA-methyltransferase (adenine-specific)